MEDFFIVSYSKMKQERESSNIEQCYSHQILLQIHTSGSCECTSTCRTIWCLPCLIPVGTSRCPPPYYF